MQSFIILVFVYPSFHPSIHPSIDSFICSVFYPFTILNSLNPLYVTLNR